MADDGILDSALAVIASEGQALAALPAILRAQAATVERACRMLHDCRGSVVVTGVGKPWHIGNKISATLASTGTPSYALHPAEARHGDLGRLREDDVVLALSNSGASEEIVALLPALARIGTPVVAIVGRADSPLARHAAVALCYGPVVEACPLGLAPSTSTTVMLAIGDALALTVQRLRRFTPEQYARFHPGGALGRQLMTCREAMRTGERVPAVPPHTPLLECMRAIGRARAGSVLLVDGEGRLLGICTDGDIRRALVAAADPAAVLHAPVQRFATVPCRSIAGDDLVQAALRLCATHKFNELPVVDGEGRLLGLLDLQDLVARGFTVG